MIYTGWYHSGSDVTILLINNRNSTLTRDTTVPETKKRRFRGDWSGHDPWVVQSPRDNTVDSIRPRDKGSLGRGRIKVQSFPTSSIKRTLSLPPSLHRRYKKDPTLPVTPLDSRTRTNEERTERTNRTPSSVPRHRGGREWGRRRS